MLDPLINCFRIPELRKKILFTVAMLFVFRVGVFVPIPGVDPKAVTAAAGQFESGALGLVNMFSGGALRRCAVFGLGIMPYISASIIFQLLATVIKPLEELQKEGEAGQRKINQYTRYATVLLCFIQGFFMARWIEGLPVPPGGAPVVPEAMQGGLGFELLCVFTLTTGTILLMWIGEQIQEHGIGNGISLLIMAGIVARMPPMIRQVWMTQVDRNLINPAADKIGILGILGMVLMYVLVVVGVVLLHQGQRRITIQTAKQIKGRRVFGGQRYYLPLKVGAAGVIPIIFAQSLLMFPGMILNNVMKRPGWIGDLAKWLYGFFQMGSFSYIIMYVVLIAFFCFFWTAVQFNPIKMADEMKERGNFIPGIRPGKRTSEYFERVMTRITLAGAAFISIIAILPLLVQRSTNLGPAAYIYGGTGILIVVGVALDLVQKVENHLLMRHYDGFLKGGTRIRGRR